MWTNHDYIIPVAVAGIIRGRMLSGDPITVTIGDQPVAAEALHWVTPNGLGEPAFFEIALPYAASGEPASDIRVINERTGKDVFCSPLRLTQGSGTISITAGDLIGGYARVEGDQPATLIAFSDGVPLAIAIARQGDATGPGSPFVLTLPPLPPGAPTRLVQVGIVGTDAILEPALVRQYPQETTPRLKVLATRPKVIAIKIAAPNIRVAHEWGDYHFANAMKKQFEKHGWLARVDCHDSWYTDNRDVDYTLTLRGRQRYKLSTEQRNFVWMISHPDRVNEGELDGFDHIFVASDVYAEILKSETKAPVSVLHQATDPEVFYPAENPVKIHPLLFIGNSRKEYRTMVRWCIEQKIDVSVFGSLWQGIIPPEVIKGEYVPNDQVYRYYSGSKILLNDHWDTMRDNGFLSNRLFDGSAAGAFILTDPVRGLAEVFGDSIAVAGTEQEFRDQVEHFLAHPEEARAKADAARQIVLENHTFEHRVLEIIRTVEALEAPPAEQQSA